MFFIDILAVIGTSAFAVSGVLVGLKNRMDLFGVFMLSVFTSSGGGLVRDIILNKSLPVFFTEPIYFFTIAFTAIISCLAFKYLKKLQLLIKLFDAVGLGVFTILSAYECIKHGVPLIGTVFISVFSGIGGSILRDTFVNSVPLVFMREIYALAAVVGTIFFYLLYGRVETNLNIYLSILLTFLIRIISIHFSLNIPSLKVKDEDLI